MQLQSMLRKRLVYLTYSYLTSLSREVQVTPLLDACDVRLGCLDKHLQYITDKIYRPCLQQFTSIETMYLLWLLPKNIGRFFNFCTALHMVICRNLTLLMVLCSNEQKIWLLNRVKLLYSMTMGEKCIDRLR